ncbi:hypothetical protein [Actinomadura welshii]|uniref:hypothetical protein n=1 Tax=Actinomadura welshii TaxID=3103817 RepID=UPI000464DC0D|nr:hypothetical protein [Actinomadura madurae]
MSALLARLLDDAGLCPPGRAPADAALPAHREAARDRVVGRLRCPASRFAELRTRLVPEDFLDLVLVADTGIEDLPDALDAVCAEPRVRPSAVEIALPGDADQARATAVMLARLPAGPRAHIGVRRSPGRRDALDRIAAARARGADLGAHHRPDGPPADTAAFIRACADRDLPFTIAAPSGHDVPNLLLAAAAATRQRATGGVLEALERKDPGGVARELAGLPEETARAVRRSLAAVSVPDLGAAMDALALIRKEAFSPSGR